MSEVRPKYPRYGPWLVGTRPRIQNMRYNIGGDRTKEQPRRDINRRSWKEVMHMAEESTRGQHVSQSIRTGYRGTPNSNFREESHSVMQEPLQCEPSDLI